MAKHVGSGCEGQASLREEEEGSCSLMDKFFGLAACAVGIGIPAGIAIECYSRLLDDSLDLLKEEAGEVHIHEKIDPYVHVGNSDIGYSSGGSGNGGVGGKAGKDITIKIRGRTKIAVGEFRSKDLEEEPLIGDMIDRRIQKNMIKYLNEYEWITAEKLGDVISESQYTEDEIRKKSDRIYDIKGLNAVLQGSYEIDEPECDSDDGDIGITVSSTHIYWGNGKFFDMRRYSVPGFVSELEALCMRLAKKVVGDHASSSTTSCGEPTPHGGFFVVSVAVWFTISR